MHRTMKKALLILAIPIFSFNCGNNPAPISTADSRSTEEFDTYWYAGKAEITTYKLQQARYGEMHEGTAVTVFVTEDFSNSKHVKIDNLQAAGSDAVKVLKLNFTKNFNTGIYPYSMMLSVFKPVDTGKREHLLKLTTSSQEWCGHTFTQVDAGKSNYKARLYSYFESEGDQQVELPLVWMEDEVWTQLRINPAGLPIGKVKMIPGLLQQRLLHTNIQAEEAVTELTKKGQTPAWLGSDLQAMRYSIQYKNQQRVIDIYFTEKFPFSILGWEESYPDGFGQDKKVLTTRAIRNKVLLSDYWNHHNTIDAGLRDSLGLK